MKRKLICIGLVLVIIMGFAACGEKEEKATAKGPDNSKTLQEFEKVQKRMADVKDCAYKLQNTPSANDDNKDMEVTATTKQVLSSKDQMEVAMRVHAELLGTKTSGDFYLKDKTIYMDMAGQKLKVSAGDEMMGFLSTNTEAVLDIGQDTISSAKMTKAGGQTTYDFVMKNDKTESYFEKTIGNAKSVLKSDNSAKPEKIDISVVANEDNTIKSLLVKATMTPEDESDAKAQTYNFSLEYISIDTGLVIDFPKLESFSDIPQLTDLN